MLKDTGRFLLLYTDFKNAATLRKRRHCAAPEGGAPRPAPLDL
jgi:hypothetical protein